MFSLGRDGLGLSDERADMLVANPRQPLTRPFVEDDADHAFFSFSLVSTIQSYYLR
jgi:hypothetical protein